MAASLAESESGEMKLTDAQRKVLMQLAANDKAEIKFTGLNIQAATKHGKGGDDGGG